MLEERRLVIPAIISQVERACLFVAESAQLAGLDSDASHHCQLSVEEICTNVIEHGYGADDPSQTIEISCKLQNGYFVITVIDDAPLFDPLGLPDPDPSIPLWERQGGGWGVYFVKKFMDRVTYSSLGQRNHFRMEKRVHYG